ncbi:hypothetical protein [Methylobacterium sp. ID0610]
MTAHVLTLPVPPARPAVRTRAGDLPTLTLLGIAVAASLVTEVLVLLVL